jgi:hypothetical protein
MVADRPPGTPAGSAEPGSWPPRQPYHHQAGRQHVGRATPVHPARPRRRPDASRWHWLLLIPIVLPLLPPLYNRMEPRFLGLPFFYWCQLAFAGLAAMIVAIVHVATKERR